LEKKRGPFYPGKKGRGGEKENLNFSPISGREFFGGGGRKVTLTGKAGPRGVRCLRGERQSQQLQRKGGGGGISLERETTGVLSSKKGENWSFPQEREERLPASREEERVVGRRPRKTAGTWKKGDSEYRKGEEVCGKEERTFEPAHRIGGKGENGPFLQRRERRGGGPFRGKGEEICPNYSGECGEKVRSLPGPGTIPGGGSF